MRLSMPFKDYLSFLKTYSNSPLTLNRITLPLNRHRFRRVNVGHVLDDLVGRLKGDEAVDYIDVAAAYDLVQRNQPLYPLPHGEKPRRRPH